MTDFGHSCVPKVQKRFNSAFGCRRSNNADIVEAPHPPLYGDAERISIAITDLICDRFRHPNMKGQDAMSKSEQKRRLVGPWRKLHGAIWILGLVILAWKDWWWPGILVLVAISMVLEAFLMQYAPQAFEKVEPPSPPSPVAAPPVPISPAQTAPNHPFDLLPSVCARCGGPIRGHEVKWTGLQSADCPYCGAKLPIAKS